MDETKAVKAIRETLNQPRVGGVKLKLSKKAFEHVHVRADYEPDRSVTLNATLVARPNDVDRANLERLGWQPGVGTGRASNASRPGLA